MEIGFKNIFLVILTLEILKYYFLTENWNNTSVYDFIISICWLKYKKRGFKNMLHLILTWTFYFTVIEGGKKVANVRLISNILEKIGWIMFKWDDII